MKKSMILILLFLASVGAFFYLKEDSSLRYTVVKGDTLGAIAKEYSVSVEELRLWNKISGDLIEVGDVLKIESQPLLSKIPSTVAKANQTTKKAPTLHKMGMRAPTKKMPNAKRCLSGPVGSAISEGDMMTNQGLSSRQISSAMNNFFPQLSACMPEVWPTANIEVDFNVGCNGLVSYVGITRDDGLDFEIQGCLENAFQYAEFPAHDLPDGMDFAFPIQFSAD
jgi:hypothetical protein